MLALWTWTIIFLSQPTTARENNIVETTYESDETNGGIGAHQCMYQSMCKLSTIL